MEAKTIFNTRLIAEYMGYEVIDYQHNKFQPIYNGNKYAKNVGELRKLWGGLNLEFTGRFVENVKYPFETDFNYLIPVIRQIEEQGFVVHIAGISYKIYNVLEEDKPIVSLVCGDKSKKTKMVHDLIIEFLKSNN